MKTQFTSALFYAFLGFLAILTVAMAAIYTEQVLGAVGGGALVAGVVLLVVGKPRLKRRRK